MLYIANGLAEIIIIPLGTKSISAVKGRFEIVWFEGKLYTHLSSLSTFCKASLRFHCPAQLDLLSQTSF
jgi:hypothetical protein